MEAALHLSALLPFLQGRHVIDHSHHDRDHDDDEAFLSSDPASSWPRTSPLKRQRDAEPDHHHVGRQAQWKRAKRENEHDIVIIDNDNKQELPSCTEPASSYSSPQRRRGSATEEILWNCAEEREERQSHNLLQEARNRSNLDRPYQPHLYHRPHLPRHSGDAVHPPPCPLHSHILAHPPPPAPTPAGHYRRTPQSPHAVNRRSGAAPTRRRPSSLVYMPREFFPPPPPSPPSPTHHAFPSHHHHLYHDRHHHHNSHHFPPDYQHQHQHQHHVGAPYYYNYHHYNPHSQLPSSPEALVERSPASSPPPPPQPHHLSPRSCSHTNL